MKNLYEIKGDVVIIHLNRGLSTIIDLEDLEKVDSHPGTWSAYPGGRGTFYVQTRIPGNRNVEGAKKHMKLARFIMDAEEDEIIDHDDRDTLNNTRKNLVRSDEQQNRYNSRVGSNNTSGHTGVWWNKFDNKWNAVIYHEGKKIWLGQFDDKEKAIQARKDGEKKYRKGGN